MASTEKRILRAQEIVASDPDDPKKWTYLDPKYPGLQPQKVLSVERLDGKTTRIVTDTETYELPHYHPMQMPCRADGSTVDYRGCETPPKVNQLAFGDLMDDPFDPNIYHVIMGMRRFGSADPFEVVVQTYTEARRGHAGHFEESRGTMFQPFEPMRRPVVPSISAESRSAKPLRGPYHDTRRPGVIYWFWVHPSGKGRWPVAMDAVFQRKTTPDTYKMRPPGQKAWEQAIWNEFEFHGNDDSDRHPYDPYVLRKKRSQTWKAYASIQHRDDE